ncbi:hypothetical protein NQ317_010930 [Molorchus minor]|uniref:HMG box domain-containing protein n=1 Tax=Molorchus minor TaxID=1323400 RepID=A0ABQ9J2R4_9CUCU|nr:hypothetical protein NQ317_010930 [Molorchus minor]
MMSDESENDGVYVDNEENDLYYKKYKLLVEECAQLQRANEILVFRIQEVNKITKRRLTEVKSIKQKLLMSYEEDWTVIPIPDTAAEEEDDKKSVAFLMLKEKIKEEKNRRREGSKCPKRPSNPFFQFCQEQRQILMEQISAELRPGEVEPSKQELTRQLAIKWKSLSVSDKKGKVYVDRYERSKEKYVAEMEEYNMKKIDFM